jgi:hypothetical protein
MSFLCRWTLAKVFFWDPENLRLSRQYICSRSLSYIKWSRVSLLLWRWRHQAPLKKCNQSNKPHTFTLQNTIHFQVEVNLNIAFFCLLYQIKILTICKILIIIIIIIIIIISGTAAQRGLWPHITRYLDHTKRRATIGRTTLDEWSARRRDLYLTTHTTDKHPCPRWDFFLYYFIFPQYLIDANT